MSLINFKFHKAKYLFLINKVDEAINLLKEIISTENNIEFIGLLCRIYFMTSRLTDGNKLLTEQLSKYPNNPKLLRFKCFRSLIEGNFDEGWKLYKYSQSNYSIKFQYSCFLNCLAKSKFFGDS